MYDMCTYVQKEYDNALGNNYKMAMKELKSVSFIAILYI